VSTGKIHVALTFDDPFWAPAYAVMRSASLASRRPADLVFHLFHLGLTAAHRAQFDAITTEFGGVIADYDLGSNAVYADFVRDLSIAPPFTSVIYTRLQLDALLPKEVERVVYLDCDTFVRGALDDLAELDLKGKPIAAVLDAGRHKMMLGRDLRQNLDLFSYQFGYFNSGVMVIDRVVYGRADLPGRTRAYHADGTLKRIQYDQAVLNLVFKDNWLPLDFRWNLICPWPAHEVLEPQILHYTGYKKPWRLYSRTAFAAAYRHAMTNAVFYRYWRERMTVPLRRLVGRK
jgi:lipopolysaccharide biosynthesis glycosyltransferase